MEDEANMRVADGTVQARFLKELNKIAPAIVIQRVESQRFASNDAVFREYVKALVTTKRIDHASVPQMLRALNGETVSQTYDIAPSQYAFEHNAVVQGSSELNPLYIQPVDGGVKGHLWKTARTLAVGLVVLAGLNIVVNNVMGDGKGGLPRGLGLGDTVKPVSDGPVKTFDDVKGAKEAKEELKEIVSYLKDPTQFTRLGGKLPKGVLLTGPPGTGKTLLAKSIAGEAGVPFFYASGSEFEEMYVGVGARRVRDLFAAAKEASPAIVFIDEIDAIGSTRSLKEQQALKMTLNQLLVELDGFNETEGVIIVGATNFPEMLDPALVRPGRFDRNVVVPLPDLHDRMEILDLYLSKIPLAEDVDVEIIARGTPGASGADLANLVNIAALRASTQGADLVGLVDLEFAKDKVQMGPERKSAFIPEAVRKVTAYHEGGHALVAMYTVGAMPIHKATIMPRGQALGMVHQLPEENDMLQQTRRQMLAQLDTCMGGRVAEELIFGPEDITSGASSDIRAATDIARRMVEIYGMGPDTGFNFVGGQKNLSDETKQKIDDEVHLLLQNSYERAKKLLHGHRKELERLAAALLEHESLTGDQIRLVVKGKKIPPLEPLKPLVPKKGK